jgi:hypothetical protein
MLADTKRAEVNLASREEIQVLQQNIAELVKAGKPISDELQERSLRLLLRDQPYDLELTRSLIALLHRTGRPPLPDCSMIGAAGEAGPNASDIESLLRLASDAAREGDTFRVYSALWQACLRYPQSLRGWAEFARALSDRRDWVNCRIAASHVLSASERPDIASATATLCALRTLAENGELATLDWRPWVDQLTPPLLSHPHTVALLLATGRSDKVAALLPILRKSWPEDVETWIVAADAACEMEQPREAYDCLRRAFDIDVRAALHAIIRGPSKRIAELVDTLGKGDELADWLSEQSRAYEGINLIPPTPAPEALRTTQELRRTALERGLPSSFLITLSKSASVSVGNIFGSGFGLPTVLYSFVNIRVVSSWLQDYLKGGGCYVTHLNPTPRNIELLVTGGVLSVIVQVRDLRQWILSMAGHLHKYPNLVAPSLRPKRSGDENEAIAIAMDELPDAIAWIDGWIKAGSRLTVHFTTYEEFIRDKQTFIDKILALYGGDTRFFDAQQALQEHAGTDYHRRRGLIDEWKEVLTREQVTAVNRLIPDYFWSKFGWQP